MAFSKKLGECRCERCDYFWKPKPVNGNYIEPTSCAKCKSKVWNKPRKYNLGTLESALIVTKREKPTGRAAAKAKKVAIETDFNIVPGDIITTSWNTGPYEVVEVNQLKNKKYSLTLVLPGTKKNKDGKYSENDLFWVNNITREGNHYPSGEVGEVFVQKNSKANANGVFTEYETLVIAKTKKLSFEILLATEYGLWYVSHRIELGTYGSLGLPSRSKYRTAFESREKALLGEANDIGLKHSRNPEIMRPLQEFLNNLNDAFAAFEQFKPTLEKLRKEGLRSGSYDWWKSRWYEFVDYKGNDSYSERIRKNDLEKLFPKVWQIYQGEFTKL